MRRLRQPTLGCLFKQWRSKDATVLDRSSQDYSLDEGTGKWYYARMVKTVNIASCSSFQSVSLPSLSGAFVLPRPNQNEATELDRELGLTELPPFQTATLFAFLE